MDDGPNTEAKANPAWDVTTDPNNPQPRLWPVCPTCHVTYVYKQFMSLSQGGYVWCWARDCKHRPDAILEGPAVDG